MTIADFCEIFLGIQSTEDPNKNQDFLNFLGPDSKLEIETEQQECLKYIINDYKNIKVHFVFII